MIPAILSCVFVLYLYRTLNAVESDLPDATGQAISSEGHSPMDNQLAALAQQVESLNARLQSLIQRSGGNDR